ncbi:hypothetical protein KUTeg_011725 [Tegillarca granosa]|uniref:Uncharacterized protein n=1 Tax=Tegillarca granosa TaxID=220873 RepID=A0ABQ9EXH4_TEGGR|nr:hypothetical protein KUTeg_011725 [Tegillarca granosa]
MLKMPTRRSEPQTDRGWAWIVLVACFFESTLVFGVLKSFGLLFVEFLKVYHTTASTISWVISVQTITFSVIAVFVLNIGPLYVQNRTFVVCGGFVASAAYIVSAFAENVEILFLSNGVMFGAIRDSSGSYIGSFHMIGTCLIVAALILLLEPLARKYQNHSSETGNNKDDIT